MNKCRYCQFEVKPTCPCLRCMEVRATGYCNTYHADYFQEEKNYELERMEKSANA